MTMQNDFNDFKVMMQLEKSRSYERTANDGTVQMVIGGLASGTTIDHHDDRMAKTAVDAFKRAIDEGVVLPDGTWSLIPLRTGHRTEWNDILGWITKAEIDDQYNLWIEAELDERNDTARSLYTNLTQEPRHGKPLQLGLSVGGKIKKASFEWDGIMQKRVRIIEDVVLNEISVVSSPANPATYVEALAKSVNWDEVPLPREEIKLNKECSMSDLQKPDETVIEQAKDEVITKTDSTTTTSESQPAANPVTGAASTVENAQEGEEVAKSTDPVDPNAAVSELREAVAKLTEVVNGIVNAPKTDVEVTKSETVKVIPTEELTKATSERDDILKTIQGLFEQFKVEVITPLTEQVELTKSAIVELANEPQDKSVALAKSKDIEKKSAIESFEEDIAKAREAKNGASIMRTALQHAGVR